VFECDKNNKFIGVFIIIEKSERFAVRGWIHIRLYS